MISGTAVGGEVGTVWNGKIVPKVIGIKRGNVCCRTVPVSPRIVAMGSDRGDRSDVAAHVKSPAVIVCCEIGVVAG